MKFKLNILLVSIIFLLFLCSCEVDKLRVSCYLNDNKEVECKSKSDGNLFLQFHRDKLNKVIKRTNYGEQVWVLKEGTSKIESFRLNETNSFFQKEFDSIGKVKVEKKYDENIKETICRFHNENTLNYQVYYVLPDNVNKNVITYYFTINSSGDTLPNYSYYEMNDGYYKLITDNNSFSIENKQRDSMLVFYSYVSELKEAQFYSPKKHHYYINLSSLKENKVYNELVVKTNNDSIVVGNVWSFMNLESNKMYSYQMIIFNGNLKNRIKEFENESLEIESINNDIISNQGLMRELKSLNCFKILNDKIVANYRLKEIIGRVGNGTY